MKENKGVNRRYNRATGHHVSKSFFSGDKSQANKWIAPRINGNFTGTTAEILRWAACKWGVDQNMVFAQAAVESWWRQTTKGDWESSGCPPGHGPGVDGRSGLCPQSWGILQNRYPYEKSSWPGIAKSTAMNADTAYAIWRACFDGYETWLNTVEHGQHLQGGRRMGLHRALVRRTLAHPAGPAVRLQGQAVSAREDLEDQELPAALGRAVAGTSAALSHDQGVDRTAEKFVIRIARRRSR